MSKWKELPYGNSQAMEIADIFNITVSYAIVIRGEEPHYRATICGKPLKKHFKSMEEAKKFVLRIAHGQFRLAVKALEEIIPPEDIIK
jgi:hypothetical protein